MSHLHIPDGVLPPLVWIAGLLLALVGVLVSAAFTRGVGPQRIAFQSALGGLMLAVMAIPVPITKRSVADRYAPDCVSASLPRSANSEPSSRGPKVAAKRPADQSHTSKRRALLRAMISLLLTHVCMRACVT